jgi:hypothetical protein
LLLEPADLSAVGVSWLEIGNASVRNKHDSEAEANISTQNFFGMLLINFFVANENAAHEPSILRVDIDIHISILA